MVASGSLSHSRERNEMMLKVWPWSVNGGFEFPPGFSLTQAQSNQYASTQTGDIISIAPDFNGCD